MEIRRLLFYCITLAGTALFLIQVAQTSLGANATNTSFGARYLFSSFLPEGWGFFTRNPREERLVLYHVRADKSLEPATYKNASASNLWGFSRRSRRVHLEFGRIIPQLREQDWRRFGAYPLPTLLATDSIKPVATTRTRHGLRLLPAGEYVVKRYHIVPWSWARYPEHYTNPEQFLKLTIL